MSARLKQRGAAVGLLAAAVLLSACQDKASEAPPATAAPVPQTAPSAPAPAPAPAPVAAAPAAPVAAPAVAAAPRKVPLSVQGVASAGLTVRVKSVDIGADATVLDVSISFANRITGSTMLALADTYLEDEGQGRLQIKRPDNNRDLTIREGQTLNGQLVFMGAVAPSSRTLRLVFNDGNQGDNIVAPGLTMELPLQGH
ncbi:hypothetical protein GCM10027082_17550 [Comamonas humi]